MHLCLGKNGQVADLVAFLLHLHVLEENLLS